VWALSILLVGLGVRVAHAADRAGEQRAALARAEEAERAFRLPDAVKLHREALLLDERSRLARRIQARLTWLEARSEGGYAPLAALMRMQAQGGARSVEELDRFETGVQGFPEGLVRREAWALIAHDWRERFHDPVRALAAYRSWLAESGINDAERQRAEAGAALARARLGHAGAALDQLEDAGLGDRAEAVLLRARRVGRIGSVVAAVFVVAFMVLGIASGGWRGIVHARAAFSPARLMLGLYVLGAPVLITALYDDGRIRARLALVVASMATVVIFAALFGAGITGSARRVRLVASLGALATLAAGFVALDWSRLLFDIMLGWSQLR
jgi:hypothetical protein